MNWMPSPLAALLLLQLLAAASGDSQAAIKLPCGKKLRIATHSAPPFINVDPSLCNNQRCPPEAFGEDGGLTYKFVNTELKAQLEQQCKDLGEDGTIEMDWYLPMTDRTSATGAVNMVCNGDFKQNAKANLVNGTYCLSGDVKNQTSQFYYKGPSPKGFCASVDDPACVSKGPDMVAGAVHILVERLSMLQFTSPYLNVQQSVAKRPDSGIDAASQIFNTFGAFDILLWVAIVIECIIVWFMLLVVEARVNEDIAPGWDGLPDTFYWVFSTLLGGADKAPITIGGKIIFCAHTFFSVVIIATFTGSVAAFLTQQASVPVVTGFSSLESGSFTVVVRGPSWDSDDLESEFLGTYVGGNSNPGQLESMQFRYLQFLMRSSAGTRFSIFSTTRMESRDANGFPLNGSDPCKVEGAQLGAYDMVACSKDDGAASADTLIFDTPAMVYELNRRYAASGTCKLLLAGKEFNPTGFGIGFPFSSEMHIPFTLAILNQTQQGVVSDYVSDYKISKADSQCEWDSGGGLVMRVEEMSGVFILSLAGFIVAIVVSLVERHRFFHVSKDVNDDEALQKIEANALDEHGAKHANHGDLTVPDDAVAKTGDAEKEPEMEEVDERVDEMTDQMSRIEELAAKIQQLNMMQPGQVVFEDDVHAEMRNPANGQKDSGLEEEPSLLSSISFLWKPQ